MKYLSFVLLLSFHAEAHELFCQFPGGPGGNDYSDDVDTIEQDLRNGARAVATRRVGNGSSLVYELAIQASGKKLVSTSAEVPLRLGNGNQNGIVLKLNSEVSGDQVFCEFRI